MSLDSNTFCGSSQAVEECTHGFVIPGQIGLPVALCLFVEKEMQTCLAIVQSEALKLQAVTIAPSKHYSLCCLANAKPLLLSLDCTSVYSWRGLQGKEDVRRGKVGCSFIPVGAQGPREGVDTPHNKHSHPRPPFH